MFRQLGFVGLTFSAFLNVVADEANRAAPINSVGPLQSVIANKQSVGEPAGRMVATSGPNGAPTESESISAKRDQVATQLRVALLQEQSEQSAAENTTNDDPAEVSRVDLLKQLEAIVAQQQQAIAAFDDLQSTETELEKRLASANAGQLEEDPPYSILQLDRARDDLRSTRAKVETASAAVLAARQAVENAKDASNEQAQRLRQLRESLGDGAATPAIEAAQLSANVANETLVLRRQELANQQASQANLNLQLEVEQARVGLFESRAVFSEQTLQEKLAEIDERESTLKRLIAALTNEEQFAEQRRLVARQQLDSTVQPGTELVERVDALKVAQQAIQNELSVTNQRLGRFPMIKKAWERRYKLISRKATREERRTWLEETKRQRDDLQRDRRVHELKLDELRVSHGSVAARIEAANGDSPAVRRWLQQKSQSISKQIEVYNTSLNAIDGTRRTLNRLILQLDGEPGRTFAELVADSWLWIKWVWNYELTSVDDTSVTVGKVLSSLFLFVFGFFIARWLSALLARRLPRMGVNEAASSAIESLSFYVLIVAFALAALKYANVPLTVFAFLGGAIAIGLGFGSQNVMNNFISGLILLAERPIKVGDLISIDATFGNVTRIGARSTQIRTGDNQDIIVPNSRFLESNVINLTRRDDRLRTSVAVGVAYGSPLDSVIQLMTQAATDERSVHEHPKPMVWFNDFGDNSLVFQVHFWISARTVAQMRSIETNVRLSIDRLFREHGVVIAFPQRDLHIQTPQPIDFRLVNGAGDSPGDNGTPRRRLAAHAAAVHQNLSVHCP